MNILIADKLSSKAVSELEKMGAQVTLNPDLSAEDLPAHVENALRSPPLRSESSLRSEFPPVGVPPVGVIHVKHDRTY